MEFLARDRYVNAKTRVLRTLVSEFKERGCFTFKFRASDWFLAPGNYVYRLQTGGQVFSRGIRV